MRERRPLFGYGLQRSGMSAVYHSVCERVDFSIGFDTLWHSCGISTRQWKGYAYNLNPNICQPSKFNFLFHFYLCVHRNPVWSQISGFLQID